MNAITITIIIAIIGVAAIFLAEIVERSGATFGTATDFDGLTIVKGVVCLIPVILAFLRMEPTYLWAIPMIFIVKIILTAIFKKKA